VGQQVQERLTGIVLLGEFPEPQVESHVIGLALQDLDCASGTATV
jgi:hypothetical protein